MEAPSGSLFINIDEVLPRCSRGAAGCQVPTLGVPDKEFSSAQYHRLNLSLTDVFLSGNRGNIRWVGTFRQRGRFVFNRATHYSEDTDRVTLVG